MTFRNKDCLTNKRRYYLRSNDDICNNIKQCTLSFEVELYNAITYLLLYDIVDTLDTQKIQYFHIMEKLSEGRLEICFRKHSVTYGL